MNENEKAHELPMDELEEVTGGAVGVYTKAMHTLDVLLGSDTDKKMVDMAETLLKDAPLTPLDLAALNDQ